MAQIHALTPEGRLPTAAVTHVQEIVSGQTWSTDIPVMADWRTDVGAIIRARRSGDVVTVTAWRLAVIAGTTGTVDAYEIPAGFRPLGLYDSSVIDSRGNQVRLTNNNIANVTNPASAVSHHTFTYITADPPPTQ